jgi:putative PEP-CTERM system histidine kinase
MVGFAAESTVVYALQRTTLLETQQAWLQVLHAVGFLLPLPWALLLLDVIAPRIGDSPRLRWPISAAVGGLALLGLAAAAVAPPFQPVAERALTTAWLTAAGRYGIVVQLLATVAILGGLEGALRSTRQGSRWRIKYLILGLGGIFVVRFYVQSTTLLFQVLPPAYLITQAAAVLVGNAVIAVSVLREGLLDLKMTISRQVLYRSVVVAVAGIHLLLTGLLGWVLNRLGVPHEAFWTSLVVFTSALGLAAFLLSEDVRWRAKRFLSRHFYASKYDYRDQWISFTNRLGSLVTVEELAPQLIGAVADAIGTTKGALYLFDSRDGRYHLVSTLNIGYLPAVLQGDSTLVELTRGRPGPLVLSQGGHRWEGLYGPEGWTSFADVAVAVPLAWQSTLTGILLVGPERTGEAYSSEDLELLATVAEQAAGAIVTTQLSEALTRAREFDAFHRLTSFVVHDLKNAVSALSLLSRNALDHFDDPEFQRDALRTLAKTVERMRALMGRLASSSPSSKLRFAELELPALLQELAEPLVAGKRIAVVMQLDPVPPILADREALEQALQNLLTNAVEAMGGEGRITLRSEMRNGQVACVVSDTGCGIPPEFLQKSLFVPFQTTKKGGWGLGLYQAREIVTAHHGQMTVQTEEGKGTTWILTFAPAAAGRPTALVNAS